MVTQGNEITASDINAIITKINNEENGRGVGLSDIGSVDKQECNLRLAPYLFHVRLMDKLF